MVWALLEYALEKKGFRHMEIVDIWMHLVTF